MAFTPEQKRSFVTNGFILFKFKNIETLKKIQDLFRQSLGSSPTSWTGSELSFDEHVRFVNQTQEKIISSGLIPQFLLDNVEFFVDLLGPDIDTQSRPHVRISRPSVDEDMIAWHRDTFYGSSPYELNLWFPIFDLPESAGLKLIAGTHDKAPKQLRELPAEVRGGAIIEKGSAANQAGFLYAPKSDEVIDNLHDQEVTLLRPQVGEAVLFFSSIVHVGQNSKTGLRVSIDQRFRSPHSPTQTKPGYYVPLIRGPVFHCAESFLKPAQI